MKKIKMIMMGLMLGASSLYAQPGSVQKLAKSVFTLTTQSERRHYRLYPRCFYRQQGNGYQHLQAICRSCKG